MDSEFPLQELLKQEVLGGGWQVSIDCLGMGTSVARAHAKGGRTLREGVFLLLRAFSKPLS